MLPCRAASRAGARARTHHRGGSVIVGPRLPRMPTKTREPPAGFTRRSAGRLAPNHLGAQAAQVHTPMLAQRGRGPGASGGVLRGLAGLQVGVVLATVRAALGERGCPAGARSGGCRPAGRLCSSSWSPAPLARHRKEPSSLSAVNLSSRWITAAGDLRICRVRAEDGRVEEPVARVRPSGAPRRRTARASPGSRPAWYRPRCERRH
jgi:hypothetical protein